MEQPNPTDRPTERDLSPCARAPKVLGVSPTSASWIYNGSIFIRANF